MSTVHYKEIFLKDEPFLLLPQKAIYRPLKQQLILSDVHLGKATHFRKQGIPMPAQSHLKDLDKIHYLLNTWKPATLVILGDLFHSDYNREWLWFKSLVMEFSSVEFILVEGNHDILPESAYEMPNLIKLHLLEEEHFIFSHHPLQDTLKINFCGHLHPGVRIDGRARQSMKLPCFYYNNRHFILPAFGNLTGLFMLEQEESSCYYLVANDRVIKL